MIIFRNTKKKILIVLALFSFSGCSQQYVQSNTKDSFIDNGTYVKVNGHKMYYLKKGQGTPTVIFESGADIMGHLSWFKVQKEVSKFATTLSYDRAGIFRSEESSSLRTCKNIVHDLHTLLQKLNAKKPYVLVAHSMGGLFARCYMKKYPNGFDGIVLVDAGHPYQVENAPKEFKDKIAGSTTPSKWLYKLTMFLGGNRSLHSDIDNMSDKYRGKEADKRAVDTNYKRMVNGFYEEIRMFSSYLIDSRAASFSDVPLVVLNANKYATEEDKKIVDYFSSLQKDSLKLSVDSKLINVDSNHYIQTEKPNVVVDAIKEIINKIKK